MSTAITVSHIPAETGTPGTGCCRDRRKRRQLLSLIDRRSSLLLETLRIVG
jgi:hypothetical protein